MWSWRVRPPNSRRLIPEEPPAEKVADDGGDEDGADHHQEAGDPDVAVIRFELLGHRNPDQPEAKQGGQGREEERRGDRRGGQEVQWFA
jgi:hypothetical protein